MKQTMSLRRTLSAGAAVALLATVVVGTWFATIGAELDRYSRLRLASYDLEIVRSRLAASAASLPELRERRSRMTAVAQGASGLLEGASVAIAAANLQTGLRGTIERMGGLIRSSQNIEPRQESGLLRIGVALEFRATCDGIARILQEIEYGASLIVVDRLSLRHPDGGNQPSPTTAEVSLQARIEVAGFWRGASQ